MSQQPSVADNVKDTASSVYQPVPTSGSSSDPNYDDDKDKTNFKKDLHGNPVKKGDLKDQLNEAAMGSPARQESYIEKGVLVFVLATARCCLGRSTLISRFIGGAKRR